MGVSVGIGDDARDPHPIAPNLGNNTPPKILNNYDLDRRNTGTATGASLSHRTGGSRWIEIR